MAGLSPAEDAAAACTGLSLAGAAVHAARSRKRRAVPAPRCSGGRETSVPLALSFTPSRGPFGPSAAASAYYALCRLLTGGRDASRRPQSRRTPARSPGVGPAAFPAHPPDSQARPLMDMDFAVGCPLVRPSPPRIRLPFVGSRVRSALPSDGPSRFRPCASLVLHLHQVAQGTFTPKLLDMPSPQPGACGAPRVARLRGLTAASGRGVGSGAVGATLCPCRLAERRSARNQPPNSASTRTRGSQRCSATKQF